MARSSGRSGMFEHGSVGHWVFPYPSVTSRACWEDPSSKFIFRVGATAVRQALMGDRVIACESLSLALLRFELYLYMDRIIRKKISFLPFLFLVPPPLSTMYRTMMVPSPSFWSKGPSLLGLYSVYAPHFFFQWVPSGSLKAPGQICSL